MFTPDEVTQAAERHLIPEIWLKDALLVFDVAERGLDFAACYAGELNDAGETDHVTCMQRAVVLLDMYRTEDYDDV